MARWTSVHGPQRPGGAGIPPTGHREGVVAARIRNRALLGERAASLGETLEAGTTIERGATVGRARRHIGELALIYPPVPRVRPERLPFRTGRNRFCRRPRRPGL